MADVFTETTHQSWFSRIGESFKSLLFGLLLFVVSFPLLFWNEGRAVKTAKSLNEGESVAVAVASDRIDTANDGKLIHTSGVAETVDTLRDKLFAVETNAIRLSRSAEIYQWDEDVRSETKTKLGGGKETRKTYTYNKKWSSRPINSDSFKKPGGHQNPKSMSIQNQTFTASNVTLGGFKMSPDLVSQIAGSEAVTLDEANIPEQFRDRMKLAGSDQLYLGANPDAPEVGDVRVRFQRTPAAEVSIVAQQTGETFKPYHTDAGRDLSMLEMGQHDLAEMFQHARDENQMWTWILRAVGAGMMLVGLMMLMSPLAVLGDVIPILGRIVSGGTFIVAGLITLVLAPLTIAVAWIVYRPIVAIPLVAVSLVALYFLFARGKSEPLPEVMTLDEGDVVG